MSENSIHIMKMSSKLIESLLKSMTVMKSRDIFNSKISLLCPHQNNTLLLCKPEPSRTETNKSSTTGFRLSGEQLRNILSIIVFFD